MTSPYAAGGGGTHLEARIAASYLAAMLCEALPRGLPGDVAREIRTQRADFGDPLDDIIVDGKWRDGRKTQLHLQVKRQLAFTEKDQDWAEVVRRAWDTFTKEDFDPVSHRIGAGIGVYSARADQHYQAVLNWARHSADAADFFARITKKDFSHQARSDFVASIRAILQAHASEEATDDAIWRLLKCFVIIHFDFESTESSRDANFVLARIKTLLRPEDQPRAAALWDHLVAKAGELIPAGGSANRGTLLSQLQAAGYQVQAAPSFVASIRALGTESERALGDIKTTIHGLRLHRADAHRKIALALDEGRFIQIDGEPGVGKSALLKEFAEECSRSGPVFVLKDARIHPRGWGAHSHIIGASDDLLPLLREFACAGEPILFIDGIDKITDPAAQLTVNDLVRAIATQAELTPWRILVTIREQNLTHLKTWLDQDAMRQLPLRTVRVEPLGGKELSVVAQTFPTLAPLLMQGEGPDLILKRPFFLNALLGLAGLHQESALPATEVELLQLWWQLGGGDRKDPAAAQHRRNLLHKLAEALLNKPNVPIAIHGFDPDIVDQLRSAGILRDKSYGHSVEFTHDIFEEWALCEFLIGSQEKLSSLLSNRGEPDILIRPVQLLGAFTLESETSLDAWQALLADSGEGSLRPVWQRAVLTASLQSTRTTSLLEKLASYLLEGKAERLRKLLRALTTLEVAPNPIFLDEKLTPGLEAEERATFAGITAVPKPLIWIRFLNWLMPRMNALPPFLIPDILPLFTTWQNSFGGRKVRHGREIGEISYTWLQEIEKSVHPAHWEDLRDPYEGAFSGRDAEDNVRALFLASTGDVPDLATEYLRAKTGDKHAHVYRASIVKNCGALVRHIPKEFVDFFLAAFREKEDDSDDPFRGRSSRIQEDFGIAGEFEFYPASPLQLPFLLLLRTDTEQGLRLIHGLSNHAVKHWQDSRLNQRPSERLTPIPIELELPWGTQRFWGDGNVYQWFRAVWGHNVITSALMALEQWALEQLEEGRAFEEVFRKVVEGNETVAALGIGVSLCLARSCPSLACAFPLVTCPHLWKCDLGRWHYDRSNPPPNEIGNWQKDQALLQGVRALNQRSHRRHEIRNLLPYFVFSNDADLLASYTTKMRDFPDRLPLVFEEEKSDGDHIAALREEMVLFAEQADPQHWKSEPAPDGQHTKIWNDPPSLKKERYQTQNQEHARHAEFVSVALWADKSLQGDRLDGAMALADCLEKARAWDDPGIFDERDAASAEQFCPAAVAGVACAAAIYADAEIWTDDVAAWCLDVIDRAATAPERPDNLMVRDSLLTLSPVLFAVHGYSALLARGYATEQCQKALLFLALDALTRVQQAVVTAAKRYANMYPRFYWTLFDLFIRQCIVARDAIPDYHSIIWSSAETEQKLALLDRAEASLTTGNIESLPRIPLPWVHTGRTTPRGGWDTKGYERNDHVWLYNIAGKVLQEFSLDTLLGYAERRGQLLALARELLEYTFQEIIPPFASSRRDRSGNTPFEWVFTFSNWCGALFAHLTPEESEGFLARIREQDNESALLIMRNVMRQFMIDALLKPSAIRDEDIAMWEAMVGWLFTNPEWRPHRRDDYLDREFTSCALLSMFCADGGFASLVCGVDPGWPHLQKFVPLIQRAVAEFGTNRTLFYGVVTLFKRGGGDLLPDPGLAWLRDIAVDRKSDQAFWKANGETLVELFRKLLAERRGELADGHCKCITEIADILVDSGVRGAGFLQQELVRPHACVKL